MGYKKKEPVIECLEWEPSEYWWYRVVDFFDIRNEVESENEMFSAIIETLKEKIINASSFHIPLINLDVKKHDCVVKTKYSNGEISFRVLSKEEFEKIYEGIIDPLTEDDIQWMIDRRIG